MTEVYIYQSCFVIFCTESVQTLLVYVIITITMSFDFPSGKTVRVSTSSKCCVISPREKVWNHQSNLVNDFQRRGFNLSSSLVKDQVKVHLQSGIDYLVEGGKN